MKLLNALMITATLFATVGAHAAEKVLSTRTVVLPVDISKSRVKYTNAGYGQTYFVKILVPELAAETIMNHRNEGEGAPCLATTRIFSVDDLILGNPEVIKADFKIELKKILTPDTANNSCQVILRETITTTVRGFNFFHVRDQVMPARILADCQ